MTTPPQGPKASHYGKGHVPWNAGRACAKEGHEERHKHGNGNMHCAECCRARGRRSANARHARLRDQALTAYGRKCACCSETEVKFLAIDHKGGGGNAHRKEIGNSATTSSATILRWLEANKYPQDGRFQLLCHNCNFAVHVYGVCPHQGGDVLEVSE